MRLSRLHVPAKVSEDAIDTDAAKLFDPNGDGQVERGDWSAPFGDLGGAQGEEVKGYVFE
jgi:hypothetical protein